MKASRPTKIAPLIGLLVMAVAFIPGLGWLLVPGWVVSWPFFPEGIHGSEGAVTWLIDIGICAALFWSLVAYGVIKLVAHMRRDRQPNAAATPQIRFCS